MKLVHLVRHAKSDWGDAALPDHARPLSKRGIDAAKAMGRRLAGENFRVDAVFCSTAQRARETWELFSQALGEMPVSFHDGLYMVSPRDLLEFIQRTPEAAESLVLVGHNPATHDIALQLVGHAAKGQREALAQLKEKYPTGALCTIRFDAARWRSVGPGKGTLVRFLRPRDL